MNSAAEIWKTILTLLENEMTPTAVSTWFYDIEPVSLGRRPVCTVLSHRLQAGDHPLPLSAHPGEGLL